VRAGTREGDMKLRLIALAMAIAAAVGSACGSASAQDYPIKPIALVVPFQAGSTTDILGRILAGKLSDSIGQRVIVDNRAGAGGSIGTEYVARAAPDGYTIVLGTVSTHAINASIYSKLPYDPIKDFAPVIEFGAVPQVLVVNSSLPVKSVQDLIEYARARPGKVTYGSAGNGTTNHLSGALLGAREKLQLVHVPYRGGAQAITDLLANEIVFMFYPYAALLPHIKGGALRALGTTARIAALPDVPTLAEANLADFEINAWFGVFAPARTPRPIINKLNAEMAGVIRDPGIKEKLIQQGIDPVYGTPEELAALQKVDLEKWRIAVEAAGARLD
jgi:tripartite-type tricarboxylate transporter receptor subunit TctC